MSTTASPGLAAGVSEGDSILLDIVAVAIVGVVHFVYSCHFYCTRRGTRPNDVMMAVRRAWIQQNHKTVHAHAYRHRLLLSPTLAVLVLWLFSCSPFPPA
jgi:hypothetical protein